MAADSFLATPEQIKNEYLRDARITESQLINSMEEFEMIDFDRRDHCRFCSNGVVDIGNGPQECKACKYSGVERRVSSSRIGGIQATLVFGQNENGDYYKYAEYEISAGGYTAKTRCKTTAAILGKQLMGIE